MTSALDLLMDSDSAAETTTLSESNGICTIDSRTRTIFVPPEIVVGAVQSDKNAERIKFSCPKIVGDNLDLSKFSIRINFENVSSVDPDISIKDQYICEDASINGDNITFSWVVGKNAARYMGTIRFIVCAVKTDSDSNISIEWNTTVAQIPVLEGIEVDQPSFDENNKDVINQLLAITKTASDEAVKNVNSAKEQAITEIQNVLQPDKTLTVEGGIADAKATGNAISSLREDLGNRGIVNGGKNLIGNDANILYAVGCLVAGTKITMSAKDGGLLTGATFIMYGKDKIQNDDWNAFNTVKSRTVTLNHDTYYISLNAVTDRAMQIEVGDSATDFEDYVPNVAQSIYLAEDEYEKLRKADEKNSIISTAINTGIAQSFIFSSFGYYKSGTLKDNLGSTGEKITADYYNSETNIDSSNIQSLFGKLMTPMKYSDVKTLYVIITSSITGETALHLSAGQDWSPLNNPLIGLFTLKKGTNVYKVELKKQYSDVDSQSQDDFTHVLFEITSATAFENLVFDAYVFDNPNLYNIFFDTSTSDNSFDYDIIFWGDSLTAGAGGNGTTYPKICANELGITNYLNAGVGGETANTIASRNGANSMIIPVGDVNGTYSIGNLKDAYGTNILPLRQGTGGRYCQPDSS